MDFNERFNELTASKPPEVEQQLRHLAEHDQYLSIEGIVRVLEIYKSVESESEEV